MQKNRKLKITFIIVVVIGLLAVFMLNTFTKTNENIDNLAKVFIGVSEKIAYLVILFGVIQLALAKKSDMKI